MADEPLTPAGEPTDPWLVDRLLSGDSLEPGAGAEARAINDLVAALRAPALTAELVGESAALDAFDDVMQHGGGRRRVARRVSTLATLVGGKIALSAAAAAAATTVATVAAAYTGVLPEPVQNFAHHTIGAPAAAPPSATPTPTHAERGSDSPSSSTSTGSSSPDERPRTSPPASPTSVPNAAVPGLCTAYAHDHAGGKSDHDSAAFRRLAEMAGGADDVAKLCASSGEHGSKSPKPEPGKSEPTNLESPKPPKPSPRPVGPPSPMDGKSGQHGHSGQQGGKPTDHPTPGNGQGGH